MSVSGVGNSSSWFANWATQNKARAEGAAAKAALSTSALGQDVSLGGFPQADVQSVTAASGGQMNHPDASSFGQSMSSLAQAIQNGDLGAAQDAFAKTKALLQSAGVHGHHHHHRGGAKPAGVAGPNASPASADPFAAAFESIGQSLQNGDLAGAQASLSQLDTLLQGASRKLTRPPVGSDSPARSAGAIDLTA